MFIVREGAQTGGSSLYFGAEEQWLPHPVAML